MDINDEVQRHTLLQRIKARFENRPDSEHEQSFVRVAIVLLVLLYLAVVSIFGGLSESAFHGLTILTLFLAFSLIMIAAIFVNPGISIPRRVVCMFGDMGMITYLLFYYGEIMTPLYIVYLWVSSGYGLRYGNRYLAASTAMAAVGFFLVLQYNEDWHADPKTGWGLWIGLIVLPMYIASLLAKLSRALSAAEAANQAKSQFLANMSHEIRTPINGVVGLLELLSNTPLEEKQSSLVHGAQSSAASLMHLIENVLDISKIEAGRITLTNAPFDLHALINGVVGLFEYAASSKQLLLKRKIDPNCPYLLIGDELHLRQVLVNLVSNAVKFTQQGRVELTVSAEKVDENRVRLRLEVIDSGIGISETAQAYIFEPFRQEDEGITRRFGGTGLGMSIAKQLTELMGGDLSVKSEVGRGSCFSLLLNCQRQDTVEQFSLLNIPSGVRVISHDALMIGLLREWFSEWGIDCAVDLGVTAAIDESVVLLDARALPHPSTLIEEYPGLVDRDLLLLTDMSKLNFNPQGAGYVGSLNLPLEKQQLYRFLRGFQTATFDKQTPQQEEKPTAPAKAFKKGRILVAEDNLTNQLVTRSFLEQDGHKVTVVDDGIAALDVLEVQNFDLAIVDMMMPGHGGLDIIKLFRHMSGNRNSMPFVLLTANVSDEAKAACRTLGVKYLSKPLRGQVLQTVVQELLMQQTLSVGESQVANPILEIGDESQEALIDEEIFKELSEVMGSGPRIVGLVDNFYQDAESLLSELRQAVDKGEWFQAADFAHGLKGAALGLGAYQLAQRARELEQEILQGAPRGPMDPLAPVESAYRAVRSNLQARIADVSDSSHLS
ncbi:MAG: ATP-binding protein [Candidatus Thiodiazotropha sp. 6PLUC3]